MLSVTLNGDLMNCVDCEGLSVDLDNSQPYLCMYDDHWSMKLEDLSKECFKEFQE